MRKKIGDQMGNSKLRTVAHFQEKSAKSHANSRTCLNFNSIEEKRIVQSSTVVPISVTGFFTLIHGHVQGRPPVFETVANLTSNWSNSESRICTDFKHNFTHTCALNICHRIPGVYTIVSVITVRLYRTCQRRT
jgi:hypothetical protein